MGPLIYPAPAQQPDQPPFVGQYIVNRSTKGENWIFKYSHQNLNIFWHYIGQYLPRIDVLIIYWQHINQILTIYWRFCQCIDHILATYQPNIGNILAMMVSSPDGKVLEWVDRVLPQFSADNFPKEFAMMMMTMTMKIYDDDDDNGDDDDDSQSPTMNSLWFWGWCW